jgi:hypothetical protein
MRISRLRLTAARLPPLWHDNDMRDQRSKAERGIVGCWARKFAVVDWRTAGLLALVAVVCFHAAYTQRNQACLRSPSLVTSSAGAARAVADDATIVLHRAGGRLRLLRATTGMFRAHLWPGGDCIVVGAGVLDCIVLALAHLALARFGLKRGALCAISVDRSGVFPQRTLLPEILLVKRGICVGGIVLCRGSMSELEVGSVSLMFMFLLVSAKRILFSTGLCLILL